MGKQGRIGDQFRKRLKDERDRREWSQGDVATKLSDKGIRVYATTIAKLEAGDRAVRIDELVAISDLFGVSVDTLLGRRGKPKSDLIHALTAVVDTGYRSSMQIHEMTTAIEDRITDLSAFDELPGRDELVAGCDRARALLMSADDALAALREARKILDAELKGAR
jgi:transcriptional regulator with XRE-family HTH domain